MYVCIRCVGGAVLMIDKCKGIKEEKEDNKCNNSSSKIKIKKNKGNYRFEKGNWEEKNDRCLLHLESHNYKICNKTLFISEFESHMTILQLQNICLCVFTINQSIVYIFT